MKKIMILLLMCLTVFAGSASAFLVVNADLGTKGGQYVGQGAFVDPGKDFWNNGTGTNLKASDGVTVTGVSVSVSGGTFQYASVTNTLMKDYHSQTGGGIGTITISGLESNADYLIYVYGGMNSKPTTFTLNGVVASILGLPNTNPVGFVEGSNYVKMATRSNSTGVIAGTYTSSTGGEGIICGLQIILNPRGAAHTPTPATNSNLVDPVTLTQLSWLSPNESLFDPNIASVTGYDVYLRVHDPILDLVTKVEAETYTAMNGLGTETCTDTGGGLNLNNTGAGDWAEYRIDVPLKGSYAMNFRVARLSSGTATINLSLNGSPIGSIKAPKTGGWQNWTTVGTKVSFDTNEPNAVLRLDFAGSANVNWFSYQAEPNEVGYLPLVSTNQPGKSYPVSLAYDTKYDWRVDTHVTWNSTGVTGNLTDIIKGRTWQLTTKSFYMAPELRFDNVTTAMPLLPAVLTAQVTLNSKPITSAVFEVLDGAPATVTRTDSDPTNTNLTAQLTTAAAGTYFVKLTVSDGTTTVQDIAAVHVYATACEAAKHVPGFTQNYYDTNSDCVVTLVDFADLARQWLDNNAMTSPEPLQIAFGYIPVDFLVEAENAYRPQDPNFTAGAPLTVYADGDPRINNNGDIFGSSGGAFIWYANEGKFLSYQFEIPAAGNYTLYFKSGTGAANRTLEFEQVDPTTGVFIKDLFVVPVASTEAVQSATVNFPDAGMITVRVTPHTPSSGYINQDFFAFKKL